MAEDIEIEGSDLGAIVADEIRSAKGYDSTELSDKRTRAIEYMRGEMNDTPARPNGSTQTDRTFADTISWIKPGVVRTFTASDQMVQYDKVREENDDWARDASEYTNWSFFRENDGYRVLLTATDDSLQLGNGLARSYWEPERAETRWFRDKTEMELAILLEEDGWQPTGIAKPGKPQQEEAIDPMTGEPVLVDVPTLTVKLAKVARPAKICDVACKPENLFLNRMATTIEEARFVAYLHDDKTRSDLMDMADDYGWDKSVIEELPSFSRAADREVGNAREGDRPTDYSSPVKSGDPIDLYECYLRADRDGDGIAELVQCWFAGDTGTGALLSEEEYEDECPYTDIPCYPTPHRFDAQSVFDRTADIQRVKTVLLRQMLDNTYAVGMPMMEVEEGSVLNPDILISKKFGGIIWKKKTATNPIIPHETPFIGDKLMMGLNYMDEQTTKRTGISRTTMALDPEALQNQTATAAQQQRDAGYSQIELIARNMAELGWAKYFAKRLKLAVKNGLIKKIPSKKGESGFRQIDAGKWDPSMAVTINVGLGTGSRDRDMAMLNNILNGQIGMADRLGAAGMTAKAIEFLPKIRNTAVKIAESSGLKNPEEFYPEVTDEEVAQMQEAASQPQPNPKIEEIHAQGEVAAQLEQAKGQTALQVEAGKNELAVQQAQISAQGDIVKNQAELEADLQTAEAERQTKLQLEALKQEAENARFFAKLAQDRELALLQMQQAEVEEDDGQGGKKKTMKSKADTGNETLMAGLGKLGEMIGGLHAAMSAPTVIDRDPVTGKAIGTRKVVN